MNANIMNMQIFHLNKYDPSSIGWSVDSSIPKLCGSLSLTLHLVLFSPLFLLLSLYPPLLLHANINLHS